MSRKNKIIVSIVGIIMVFLTLMGVTYAYYLTKINGNTSDKSISVTTGSLELIYGDGVNKILISNGAITPSNDLTDAGKIGVKDFTVTNSGVNTSYVVVLEDIEVTKVSDGSPSTFVSDGFMYTLTCKKADGTSCGNETISQTSFPMNGGVIINQSIKASEVHNYEFKLWYFDNGEDQTIDSGKTLNAKINIKDISGFNPYSSNTNTLAYNIINNAILNENGTSLENIFLTRVAEEISSENESVLSVTGDDFGTSYYFRGNVQNNYVTFADMCWRIVRIKGNGSIKLILEDQDNTCEEMSLMTSTTESYNEDKGDFDIGNGSFGFKTSTNGLYYIIDYLGYAGGMADSFQNYQTTLAKKIDSSIGETPTSTQVNSILATKLESGDWCYNDKAYSEAGTYPNYTYTLLDQTGKDLLIEDGIIFPYDSYVRLFGRNPKEPTLKCNGKIMNNFEDDATSPTPMYVGTLTADEIVYAGGAGSENIHYYLINDYTSIPFQNEDWNNRKYWWTLSPSRFRYQTSTSDDIFFVLYSGLIVDGNVDGSLLYRPSITLKSNTVIVEGGKGTMSNPYVIN